MMGLDSIELVMEVVMEVEKAFSIRIPDREAEKMNTVGAMYDTVWRHVMVWVSADRSTSRSKVHLPRSSK